MRTLPAPLLARWLSWDNLPAIFATSIDLCCIDPVLIAKISVEADMLSALPARVGLSLVGVSCFFLFGVWSFRSLEEGVGVFLGRFGWMLLDLVWTGGRGLSFLTHGQKPRLLIRQSNYARRPRRVDMQVWRLDSIRSRGFWR